MATIGHDENGLKRILFMAKGGQRRTIRIGKASVKQAERWKARVEDLVSASKGARAVDDETETWLSELDDVMYGRLVAAGLRESRAPKSGDAGPVTLSAFFDKLFATFVGKKENTLKNYGQTRRVLEEYFGKGKILRDIDAMQADEWRAWLTGTKEKKVATATASKWTINARHFFKIAAKWKLVTENPFAEVHCGSQANRSRMFEVTRDMTQKLIDACTDNEWQLLIALARYGGVRVPSEVLPLTWDDVNFGTNRMLVRSPKTEHHAGKESRWVPIFPELQPYLLKAYTEADDCAHYVITRYRDTHVNLRSQLCRIIKRAGLVQWPKPWINLRSSRETELVEQFPVQVVTAWLGNSPKVAQMHYLQVTDSHFDRATKPTPAAQAAQNAAQCQTTPSAAQHQTEGKNSVSTP